MNKLPRFDTISNLKHNQSSVLKKMGDGPVIITRNGNAVAVLISPSEWDQIAHQLSICQQASNNA